MKLKNRIAAAAIAFACVTGLGLAVAAPAQAASHGAYVAQERTQSACKSSLNSNLRAKLMFGYAAYNFQSCRSTGTGWWVGSFSYSR